MARLQARDCWSSGPHITDPPIYAHIISRPPLFDHLVNIRIAILCSRILFEGGLRSFGVVLIADADADPNRWSAEKDKVDDLSASGAALDRQG